MTLYKPLGMFGEKKETGKQNGIPKTKGRNILRYPVLLDIGAKTFEGWWEEGLNDTTKRPSGFKFKISSICGHIFMDGANTFGLGYFDIC